MNKHLIAVASALLITGTVPAFAASTVDLAVKGIITPNACTPVLSAGGVIDHGKISAKDLNTDKMTLLPKASLQMTVTCDAAALFALKATDNRAGSAITGGYFGLGLINGTQKLGSYNLNMGSSTNPPVADGEVVQSIASWDNGTTWEKYTSFEPGALLSVATLADVSTPRPTQVLVTDINYSGYISRTDGLDLSNEVTIDGSATIEVMYL
jgi:type 1 fimbria pilin